MNDPHAHTPEESASAHGHSVGNTGGAWPHRRILYGLTAVTIGLLGGVLPVELIARLVLTDFFTCDARLGWVFEPERSGFRINRRFEYAVPVRINSAGFHDVEHQIAKPAGTVRLLLLGDSMLAGMQVPLESVFARLFESRLNADGSGPFEVINCATDGYGTAQSWLMFEERCGRYEPDVVVLGLYYYNDVMDNYYAGGSVNHPLAYRCGRSYFRVEDGGLIPTTDAAERATPGLGERTDRLLRSSYLYQVLVPYYDKGLERAFQNQDVFRLDHSAEQSEAWEITKQLLLAVDAAARSRGAKLVVMLIPSRWEIYPSWHREDRGSVDGLDIDRPRTLLSEFLGEKSIAYFDLWWAFDAHAGSGAGPLFFRHDPHWRPLGNELAATAFDAWLRKNCASFDLFDGVCGSLP